MIFLTVRTNWHKWIFSWMCCVFFVCLSLFLSVPGTGCNLWLCHCLDYLLLIFISCNQTIQLTTTYNALSNWLTWRPTPLPTSTKFFSKVVILIFFFSILVWFCSRVELLSNEFVFVDCDSVQLSGWCSLYTGFKPMFHSVTWEK